MKCDLLLRRGWLVDPASNIEGVRDLAVHQGKVSAVAESLGEADAKREMDLSGRVIVPGLIDTHVHPCAASLTEFDHPIGQMDTIQDVLDYIRGRADALEDGQWIVVQQVFITRLREQRYPSRAELDRVRRGHRTGTEASDLAFRIARTVTRNPGAIVTEDAYHGNSVTVTELSTEEYPAADRPDYLAAVEAPNPYRGTYRYGEADLGSKYAGSVGEAIDRLSRRGHKPAMFLCDASFASNGVLTAPPGYLHSAYEQVRAAGGLCVADEVQAGLCRLGDHMWGFEDSGVVPDIVTMGKPIGDGHPLAAVVTTPGIAEEFARKFHYFNTFGGNPVSAAVGLAVLDVIEQEHILDNVREVGAYLGRGLKGLAERHECIGDVRGKGLMLGIEFVVPGTLEPDAAAAIGQRLEDAAHQNGIIVIGSRKYRGDRHR